MNVKIGADRDALLLPYQINVERLDSSAVHNNPLQVQQVDFGLTSARPKFYQELPLRAENEESTTSTLEFPHTYIINEEISPFINSKNDTYESGLQNHSKPSQSEPKIQNTNISDKNIHVCYICKKTFETEAIRDKHLKEHDKVLKVSGKRAREGVYEKDHKIPLTDLQCYVCYKEFENTLQLKSHLKTEHKGSVIHICPFCNKVFSLKCNYNAHITVHKNEKPFECKMCGKTFKRKRLLKVHSEIHNKKYEYKCHLCEKVVYRTKTLKTHYNNSHKGVEIPSIDVLQAHLKKA